MVVPTEVLTDFLILASRLVISEAIRSEFEETTSLGATTWATLKPDNDGNISGGLALLEVSALVENVEKLRVAVGIVNAEVSGGGIGNTLDRVCG